MAGKHRKETHPLRNAAAVGSMGGLAAVTGPIPVVNAAPSAEWNAIIHCESGGDPTVVNSIGAGGLFQFLPSTWQGLGGSGNAANATPAQQLAMANKLHAEAGYTPWTASKHCWDTNGDGAPDGGHANYLAQLSLSVNVGGGETDDQGEDTEQVVSSRVWPAEGPLTSGFRSDGRPGHDGIDIGAGMGAPVYAAASGTVIDAGPATGYGNWIRIEHSDGTVTGYGHMPASSLRVSVGDTVEVGQRIASVGSEGQSTGPHLHFFVMQSGEYIDPEVWLDGAGHVGDEPAPTPTPAPVHEQHEGNHVVREGETLSLIAQWHGVRWEDLAAWNGITDPTCLQIGTELVVTSPVVEPAPEPELELEPALTKKEAVSTVATYTVVEGDCLSIIAEELGLDGWRGLYLRNMDQIKDPDLIYPGQVLTLP